MTESKIFTNRFYLRTLGKNDCNAHYLQWFKDEEIRKFIPSATREQTLQSINEYVTISNSSANIILLGIFDQLNDLHIGNIKYEILKNETDTAVLGILIGEREYRGKKVFPEIYRFSSEWLKKEKHVSKVILGVNKDHSHAIKSYQSVGFQI
ncbi:GNAT family N-acetyltransferase, partial [Leptospira yasudae]